MMSRKCRPMFRRTCVVLVRHLGPHIFLMMSPKCRPMFRRTCVVLPRSLLFLRWEEVVLRFALLLLHFALLFSYWLMVLALLVPHCQVGSLPSLLHNAHVVPWFLCEHVCIG